MAVQIDLPSAPRVSIDALAAPVSVLPSGFIPALPEYELFAASGSGAAVVAAAVRITAAASGSSATIVRPSPRTTAAASGVGAVSIPAFVVGQAFPTTIEAAGAGIATVTAAASVKAAATGSGTITATSTVRVAVAAAGTGTTAVNAYPVQFTSAVATGLGTSVVRLVPAVSAAASGTGTAGVSLTPTLMGMDKIGEWSPASGSTFTTIPGWSAQPQYPGTVIVGDGIQVQAGTYTLTLRLVAGDSFDLTVRSIRVLVGATEVVPDTHADSNGWTFTTTVTVPSGVLTVQYYATSSTASRRTVREGTYLTIARD